jgi:hypothetical protein
MVDEDESDIGQIQDNASERWPKRAEFTALFPRH